MKCADDVRRQAAHQGVRVWETGLELTPEYVEWLEAEAVRLSQREQEWLATNNRDLQRRRQAEDRIEAMENAIARLERSLGEVMA